MHLEIEVAGDYTEAMWLMLQHQNPDDFVIATGETHTVKEFAELAFKCGIKLWRVCSNRQKYFRPNEVEYLLEIIQKLKKY